jgi:hypothetical protein
MQKFQYLQHSGYYIGQKVEYILRNISLLKLSYRIYVTLSEMEGLTWPDVTWRTILERDIWNFYIILVGLQKAFDIRTENLPNALLNLFCTYS